MTKKLDPSIRIDDINPESKPGKYKFSKDLRLFANDLIARRIYHAMGHTSKNFMSIGRQHIDFYKSKYFGYTAPVQRYLRRYLDATYNKKKVLVVLMTEQSYYKLDYINLPNTGSFAEIKPCDRINVQIAWPAWPERHKQQVLF
ncbi:MAG: hypothetical protein GY750_16495 [Lentisphaerae bacterium]|nr:hypothetical protein [Lentisphaerota bacterium]MCP4102996.1 hypothetical protein [Lentisphaerota bacterium]